MVRKAQLGSLGAPGTLPHAHLQAEMQLRALKVSAHSAVALPDSDMEDPVLPVHVKAFNKPLTSNVLG